MAHGVYRKRRVAGRHLVRGGGGGAGGVRGNECDRKALRNQIRVIERLLKKALPLKIKTVHEQRLEDLKKRAEIHALSELHRRMSLHDRKLKFFERRKLERRIRRLEKQQQRRNLDCGEDATAIIAQLAKLNEDLTYIRFFPKCERYIPLFMGNDENDVYMMRRNEMREMIKRRVAAAAAAGSELDETCSEDDGAVELSDEDIYMEGSSSDDADADDEWTDVSPNYVVASRWEDEKDDETMKQDYARMLMPPPRSMNSSSPSSSSSSAA